jgi:hypothetical protein
MKHLLSITLCLCLPCFSETQNLLQNHSFETGLSSWNATGSVGVFPASGGGVDGRNRLAFNFQDEAASGVVWQSFPTVVGDLLEVTFTIAGQFVGAAKVRVDILNGSGIAGATIASKSFENQIGGVTHTTLSLKFVAQESISTLAFIDVSQITTSTDLYIDNASVTSLVMSQNVSLKILRAAAVSFDTVSGIQYAILASTDLITFTQVGMVVGDGSRMTFYHPASADRMFFKVEAR